MTLDAHAQGFIEALQRIDKRKGKMKTENWKESNQTNYTLEELQTCYDTSDLVAMLMDIWEEGYESLSLGLIIDLIKERVEEV